MMRIAAIALAALLTAGCAAEPVPADRFLALAPPLPQPGAPIAQRISVEPVRANGVYSERPLLLLAQGALVQRSFHFWTEPPDYLLEAALVRHLRAVFGAERVLDASSRERGALRVRTRVARMEQVAGAGGAKAVASLEFTITDADGDVLALLPVEGEQALAVDDPQGYVDALERLCTALFDRLAKRLLELAATPPAGESR